MAKRVFFLLLLILALLGTVACFDFHVRSGVDFPAGRFAAAWERVGFLERHNPDRVGRARAMHVLVYDGESRELLEGRIPVWLAKLAGDGDEGRDREPGRDVASRYVDFDECSMPELFRLGPGLLVQVDDMDDGTHVLLWLE